MNKIHNTQNHSKVIPNHTHSEHMTTHIYIQIQRLLRVEIIKNLTLFQFVLFVVVENSIVKHI